MELPRQKFKYLGSLDLNMVTVKLKINEGAKVSLTLTDGEAMEYEMLRRIEDQLRRLNTEWQRP